MKRTTVELGEVCDFLSGFAFKSELFSTEPIGLPIIRIRDVLPGSSATFYSGDYHPQYIIEKGDILIGMDGEFNRERWKSDVALLNQRVCKVIARERFVDNGYLYHALPMLLKKIEDETPFVTVKHLSVTKLKSAQITLPPLEEQRRIAAILDKAGQILSSSRQADALRQHLQVRLFISMFGDPRSNPLGWPRLSIEAITSDYVGGAALAPEDFVDQGTTVLHKGAIKAGGRIEVDSKKKGFVTPQTAQYHQRSLAGPGKVAVTLRDLVPSGPFIGLMADLSTTEIPEFLLAQGAYAFSVDTRNILPGYLIALVNMPTFRLVLRQNAVGSTQIHIRIPVFKSIEIPVPPIEKQHEFTRVVSRISSVGVSSQAQIQRIDELTRSLQSSFL